MANNERVFINSDQIRDCAEKINSHDINIADLLAQFEQVMREVDSIWDSEANDAMNEAFLNLKSSFEKFHSYNQKIVNHLRTNVAEARDALDEALRNNVSNLRRTI